MLSIKTMRLLAEYLLEAVISSASLQPYRQCLASIIGFDGTMIFHYLDQSCKGYLIAKDLVPLIKSEPNQYACQRIFSQIDSNNQKRVNRLQFISYFLPREDLALRQIISARITTNESYEESIHFKQQLDVISRMFQHILRSQSQKLGTLRNALLNKKDYSTHGVMNVLDSDKKGWIQAQDIQKFVRGQGIPIYIQDIYRLIQMHDHNMDGKLFQDSIVRLIYCGQANVPSHISQKQTQKKNKITAGKISKKQKVAIKSQRLYPSGRQCLCNKKWVASKQSVTKQNITARKKSSKTKGNTSQLQQQTGAKITKPTTATNNNSHSTLKENSRSKVQVKTHPFELRDCLLAYDNKQYNQIKTCQLRKIKELQRSIQRSTNCLQKAERNAKTTNSIIKNGAANSTNIALANQLFHFRGTSDKFQQIVIDERKFIDTPTKINFLNTVQSRRIPIQYIFNRNSVSPIRIVDSIKRYNS